MSEKDVTLGEFLRHERERRGITIEQVASATKVGVRTLHSLEADNFHDLPAKPFIRGFVTSYSRFVGLDGKEVLARFDDYISKKAIERPNRDSGHSGYAFEKKDGEQQSRTILMIAIFGFTLLGGVAMVVLKPSLRHHHSSHIEKLRAAHGEAKTNGTVPASVNTLAGPLASASIPAAHPSISAISVSAPTANAAAEEKVAHVSTAPNPLVNTTSSTPETVSTSIPVTLGTTVAGANPADPLDSGLGLKAGEIKQKVTFKALSDIWVRYQVDNRPVRKFVLRKEKTLILRGRESVRVQVSNPNSVKFSYNGHNFDKVSHEQKAVVRQGNTTLFFPFELSEKIEKPFGDAPPLESTSEPVSESLSQDSNPLSTPNP